MSKTKTNNIIINEEVVAKSQSSGVKYQGSVTASIKRGNKILVTKQYKNSGRIDLFEFFGKALCGKFTELSTPAKIKLWMVNTNYTTKVQNSNGSNYKEIEFTEPENFVWEVAMASLGAEGVLPEGYKLPDTATKGISEKTGFVTMGASPIGKKLLNFDGAAINDWDPRLNKYEVTFSFRVPFSLIYQTDGVQINAISLYAANETNDANAFAYYLFTKVTGSGDSEAIDWDPIEFTSAEGTNYSLYLDWTMTIGN